MPKENRAPIKVGQLPKTQSIILVILRLVIGWHFLFEGISKLMTPHWTSEGFLSVSKWIFSGFFNWIASTPAALKTVDFLNIWGLIFIGLALVLGLFVRPACLGGILLLLLYYLANPPFIGMDFGVITEGSYLLVDKNLIEMIALFVLFLFSPDIPFGLDGLKKSLWSKKRKRTEKEIKVEDKKGTPPPRIGWDRRQVLQSLIGLPVLGGFVLSVLKKKKWESFEEQYLDDVDTVTSATVRSFDFSSLKELKGPVPKGAIGGINFSRLILGGNLIAGWAHARDLIYVSKLIKAYHHDEKVFETLWLAEKCGVDTILSGPSMSRLINDYKRRNIGKIKFISDCGGKSILDSIRLSIDQGAAACYIQGHKGDFFVKQGMFDLIAKALDLIRENGLPAGIGGHFLETIKGCVDQGIKPDFWMKTYHHKNYWSASSVEEHDNVFCRKPDETREYMKTLEEPWIAYKVLAAGAISPEDGFKFAFEGGADFLCVGMYDFQVVENVNTTAQILGSDLKRERPWRA
jgi:uncharacterized membrane protein YphA (DoxX/SURF4 family)